MKFHLLKLAARRGASTSTLNSQHTRSDAYAGSRGAAARPHSTTILNPSPQPTHPTDTGRSTHSPAAA